MKPEKSYLAPIETFLRVRILAVRDRFMPWLPLVTYLPQVGWWLSWNDYLGRRIYLSRGFEESEQAFLLRFLQPGMIAFDIGAHHGFHTLLMSRRVGSHGLVIAFEPSPREVHRLRWTLRINRCSNVRVEPYAIGNREGEEQLFVCMGRNSGCNSLRKPAVSEPIQTIRVPMTTLDCYLQKHETHRVDLLKIDVEGAELELLEGAMGLLNANPRPVITCEMADVRTLPWGYPAQKIYDLLKSYGYLWFSTTPKGKLSPCPPKKQYRENLVAVPREKLQGMKTLLSQVSNGLE